MGVEQGGYTPEGATSNEKIAVVKEFAEVLLHGGSEEELKQKYAGLSGEENNEMLTDLQKAKELVGRIMELNKDLEEKKVLHGGNLDIQNGRIIATGSISMKHGVSSDTISLVEEIKHNFWAGTEIDINLPNLKSVGGDLDLGTADNVKLHPDITIGHDVIFDRMEKNTGNLVRELFDKKQIKGVGRNATDPQQILLAHE